MAKAKSTATPVPSSAMVKAKVTPNLPANIDEELQQELAALKSRLSAPSGDLVKLTKSKTFVLPSGAEVAALEVVVVDFINYFAYYDGKYDSKNIRPPACHALGYDLDAMVPAENSGSQQNHACVGCPQNEWKSDPNGSGKACKNMRLLALISPNNQDESPLLLLKVPPTATRFWDKYVATVASAYSAPVLKVVTRITMDPNPDVDYASPRFEVSGPNAAWQAAYLRRKEVRTRLEAIPDVSGWTPSVSAPRGRVAA